MGEGEQYRINNIINVNLQNIKYITGEEKMYDTGKEIIVPKDHIPNQKEIELMQKILDALKEIKAPIIIHIDNNLNNYPYITIEDAEE